MLLVLYIECTQYTMVYYLSLSLPDMGGSIDESLIGLLITVDGRLTNKWSFTIHRRVPRTKDPRVPCHPRP